MNSQTAPVLSIRNLSKTLGKNRILSGITLDVRPGEIFGFLGPNGSGKTTTIKLMLGLLRIDEGSISICGHDVSTDFEAAMENIGGIIENPEMYKYLTGRENLEVYARMYGKPDRERISELVRLVRLEARINDKISKYSLGMKQRLGIAQALLNRPKLLVLDEPTNGLDPAGIKELRDILRELAHTESVAVFISSHQLAELDLMCDRVGIIDRGVLLDTMTIDQVRNAGEGGLTTVSIEVESGRPVPAELAETFRYEGPGLLKGQTEREKIPETVAALCAAGFRIYSVTSLKHSIEDVFLSLTSEYTPAGGGGTPGYAPKPSSPSAGVYVPGAATEGPAGAQTPAPGVDVPEGASAGTPSADFGKEENEK
jgi:ABC-2 type transport system ATP-binding protein